jgi:DNA-binding transcriptional regulator YhcF (GntR family)
MELRIDRQALVPVVQQIVDALAEWLRRGEVSPGTRLPSVRQIARINLLSQSSVVEACERLVAQGVLATRNGAGFFVAATALAAQGQQDLPWFEGVAQKQSDLVGELRLGCGGLPESWRRHGRVVQLQHTAGLACLAPADPQTAETTEYRGG